MQFSPAYSTIINVSLTVLWCMMFFRKLQCRLHILQLEDYEPGRMIKVILKSPRRLNRIEWDFIGLLLILIVNEFVWLGVAVWIMGVILRWKSARVQLRSATKKLVMTTRSKRIILVATVLTLGLVIVLYFTLLPRYQNLSVNLIAILTALDRLSFLTLAGAVNVLKPVELTLQTRYLKDAHRILREVDPFIIGVTGSYGKTGTKELLSAMLAESYNVYRPPGSYNTLMGVTRAIREGLRPYHEAFVVEMGAYRTGSIEKLCRLTKPKHGIITIIGVQHLERFGSRKKIQQAKGELVRALPEDGVAVLNGDDPLCREIGDWFEGRTVYFSVGGASAVRSGDPTAVENSAFRSPHLTGNTLTAHSIAISTTGSDFILMFPDGEEISIHLPLLGRGAVANSTAAAAMADQLGVPREKIKRALAGMPQVRHRLETIQGEGGITIIDDAFNSNPIGAANALEVLAKAVNGRRVLVTPGMIELGKLEQEAHCNFGRQAAKACDLVVLVGGKRIQPIREGLLEGGFDESNIWIVASLQDGLERLKGYLIPGDTMLLENDLPDQYAGF